MFDLVFYTQGKSAALLSEASRMRLLWQKTKKKALFIKKKYYKAVDFYIVLVLEYKYRKTGACAKRTDARSVGICPDQGTKRR